MKQTTANQLAAMLIKFDAALDTEQSYLADLLRFTKQHGIERKEVDTAITQYVANKYGVALNDRGQLVKATSGRAKELWNNARSRRLRLLAAIYEAPKPKAKTSNKVDPVDAAEKRLVDSLSTAQLRRLIKQLQARV